MNKISALLLFSIIALSSCKSSDKFIVNGKLENATDIKRVLLYNTDSLVDSAFLDENHEFKFIHSGPEAGFYTLAAGTKSFLFVAQNGNELTFEANLADKDKQYKIEGSEVSEKIRQFNIIYNKYYALILSAQRKLASLQITKQSSIDSLKHVESENIAILSQNALKFAEENKSNLAGFYAATIVDKSTYESQLIHFAEEIKSLYPTNRVVNSFVNKMIALKPVSVGQIAPDFKLYNPEGKLIALSDYRGKYVLLDFWASWCPPCRAENPNIVKQYNLYKNKGFAILGVSLDDSKQAWLKGIKDDHLTWDHVSELKSWEQRWDGEVTTLYKIDAIPTSFLLDPSGKIVAKNLMGENLESFLNTALKGRNTN